MLIKGRRALIYLYCCQRTTQINLIWFAEGLGKLVKGRQTNNYRVIILQLYFVGNLFEKRADTTSNYYNINTVAHLA